MHAKQYAQTIAKEMRAIFTDSLFYLKPRAQTYIKKAFELKFLHSTRS